MNKGEMTLLRNDTNEQVLLIFESAMKIQINLHLTREKPKKTTYTRSRGPYVRLPFAKSLRGQNRSSTLRMKS
jgi:hypothetical protein